MSSVVEVRARETYYTAARELLRGGFLRPDRYNLICFSALIACFAASALTGFLTARAIYGDRIVAAQLQTSLALEQLRRADCSGQ